MQIPRKLNMRPETSFYICRICWSFTALVVLILSCISSPPIVGLNAAKATFDNSSSLPSGPDGTITELRLGLWGYCTSSAFGHRTCQTMAGYNFTLESPDGTTVNIPSEWTNAIVALEIIAAYFVLVAFIFNILFPLRRKTTGAWKVIVASGVGLVMAFGAFLTEIIFFALVKHRLGGLGVPVTTKTGGVFWLSFVAVLQLIMTTTILVVGPRCYHWWDEPSDARSDAHQEALIRNAS